MRTETIIEVGIRRLLLHIVPFSNCAYQNTHVQRASTNWAQINVNQSQPCVQCLLGPTWRRGEEPGGGWSSIPTATGGVRFFRNIKIQLYSEAQRTKTFVVIRYFCLCPLSLSIKLKCDILKVAYSKELKMFFFSDTWYGHGIHYKTKLKWIGDGAEKSNHEFQIEGTNYFCPDCRPSLDKHDREDSGNEVGPLWLLYIKRTGRKKVPL